jgi:hypothetical protein
MPLKKFLDFIAKLMTASLNKKIFMPKNRIDEFFTPILGILC